MVCSVMEFLPLLILITRLFGKLMHCIVKLQLIALFNLNTVAHVASQGRISGGFPMDIREAPYQVSVQFIYGSLRGHVCGGAIITSYAVLTAAHCTYSKGATLGVRAGSNEVDSGGQWRRVEKFQNHEKFVNYKSGYDISILFLESSLDYNFNVQPIQLNEQRVIKAGTLALVTGWGLVSVRSQEILT
jgi:secreted trypsin-like serine protease